MPVVQPQSSNSTICISAKIIFKEDNPSISNFPKTLQNYYDNKYLSQKVDEFEIRLMALESVTSSRKNYSLTKEQQKQKLFAWLNKEKPDYINVNAVKNYLGLKSSSNNYVLSLMQELAKEKELQFITGFKGLPSGISFGSPMSIAKTLLSNAKLGSYISISAWSCFGLSEKEICQLVMRICRQGFFRRHVWKGKVRLQKIKPTLPN